MKVEIDISDLKCIIGNLIAANMTGEKLLECTTTKGSLKFKDKDEVKSIINEIKRREIIINKLKNQLTIETN